MKLVGNWKIIIGLSVIVMIGVYFLMNKDVSVEDYFEMYPVHKNDSSLFANEEIISAITAYENGDFQKGLRLLEQEIVKEPKNRSLQFYYAMCQIGLKNYEFAIVDLEMMINLHDFNYSEPAKWYLGLLYLKENRKSDAKRILLDIKNKNARYAQKAVEVLKKCNC
ncbi:hypothetical protein QQ008_10600 [Fulvivirgaceae bacterium BMA10]|uniref:Tetratricopeptide repeat protein n=1 Tax=Splendidivirga corallicola TaxID=3051826 RepID=A0ABT8KM68_9BACT|nr:hypothetical protein [Fulvivirgaceae bacterium BMA10]